MSSGSAGRLAGFLGSCTGLGSWSTIYETIFENASKKCIICWLFWSCQYQSTPAKPSQLELRKKMQMTRVIAQHALGKSVTNLWQNSGKISQNEKSQEKRSCRSTSENGRVSCWIVWRKAPNSRRIRGPKIWPGTDQEVFNSFWSPRAPPGYRAFPGFS